MNTRKRALQKPVQVPAVVKGVGVKLGDVKLVEFCKWIMSATKSTDEEMVTAFIFFDRVKAKGLDKVKVKSKSLWWTERLLACSLLIACKIVRETRAVPSNSLFAGLLSLPLPQLNDLERTFLKTLDFHLYVSSSEYKNYATLLEKDGRADKRPACQPVPLQKEKQQRPPSPPASERQGVKRHHSVFSTSPSSLPLQPLKKVRRA
eukprot:TRINITY_DN6493_c0_g1_i1.p1 TRINITY_DN6493_c0_g1~~TRINITY_DN6493_c0_g1_i1.p1  ORF type:complete len:205 (+),score=25.34 TRINITY_DN6493_c0_g1_i1:73-687(+)